MRATVCALACALARGVAFYDEETQLWRSADVGADPRWRAECSEAWGASSTPGGGVTVREDLRRSAASASRWLPTPMDKMTPGNSPRFGDVSGLRVEFAMTRKCGSRTGLKVMKDLAPLVAAAELSGALPKRPRYVTWTITREPYSKLVSAYFEMARAVFGSRGRCRADATRRPPICSLPFAARVAAENRTAQQASVSSVEVFEAFVEDVLFAAPFDALLGDATSYHVFSQMYRLRAAPRPIQFFVRMDSFASDLLRLFEALLPARDLALPAVRSMLDTTLGHKNNPQWPFSSLSDTTQTRVLEYYKQDYICLNYTRPLRTAAAESRIHYAPK